MFIAGCCCCRHSVISIVIAVAAIWPAIVAAQDRVPDFSHTRPPPPARLPDPLPAARPEPPAVKFGVFRAFNPIDSFILEKVKAAKGRPARLCDDWDFARRASLDLVGVIPTVTDLDRYFQWKSDRRRGKWVDFLLEQPQYADHWTIFWGDLLREQSRVRGAPDDALKKFIHQALSENRPYDAWVRDLLTAAGTAEENPAAAFILRDRGDGDVLTVSVTQGFLGVQLKCAQCHDHPFDWWTQEQFRGMSGFWRGTRARPAGTMERRNRGGVREVNILEVITRPRAGSGRFLTGATSELGGGRAALAELVTRRDNPFFARAAVNRLWEKLMGEGIVSPADHLSALNPPSHPELLDWLALEFIDGGYDLKHVLRLIATSRTYQQSTVSREVVSGRKRNAPDGPAPRLFSTMPLRRMSAEQINDSILAATGRYWLREPAFQPSILVAYPPPPRHVLTVFGASDRDTVLPRDSSSSIQQSLTLLNGRFLNGAVRVHADHPLQGWDRSLGLSTSALVDALFMQILTRLPTPDERRAALRYLGSYGGLEAWEDLQWALFNTREFQFIR